MKNKIEFVDFLKGYSILSIVVFHFFQFGHPSALISKAISFGGTGIHTFLFASGFGLYLSHLKKPLPYIDFIRKRFTKIYIPYIIIVTVSASLALAIPIYQKSWYAYFGHVLFYKMFDNDIIGSYGYQFWFISTIIQFYILFPLLAKFKQKTPGFSTVIISLLISIAWSITVVLLHKETIRTYNSFFLQYLWEFVLGMYCAEKFITSGYQFWSIKTLHLIILVITGLGLYSLLALKLGTIGQALNDIPALFGYAALCILIYNLKINLINRFILFTAGISYSIFLIHFLILNLFWWASNEFHFAWGPVLLLPVLILCYLLAPPLESFFNRLTSSMLSAKQPGETLAATKP